MVRAATLPPSPADAAFSIIRLDKEAIAAAPRLDEALSQVPGVSLYERTSSLGANPTTQGVSLRGIAGSAASRALVTLDGVPQNDPFGGWVIWTRLPTEDIGGVTVVRGAGAGPYGAGALTGVVALTEVNPAPGTWTADAEFGSLGLARGAVTSDIAVGPGTLLIAASGEHSDGWIPVIAGRGAADDRLMLNDRSISLRYQMDVGPATEAWRLSVYDEDRDSGLVGEESRSRGASLSYTIADSPTSTALGWRVQSWLLASDLANTAVSVATNNQSTTLADNEYATPALGYGANAAIRGVWRAATLEVGVDLRGDVGDDHENFDAVDGALTKNRIVGGETLTEGVYSEASLRAGPVLFTMGARVDGWATFDAQRLESVIATDQSTLDVRYPNRGGAFPSGRLGARWDVGDGQWLRTAAYSGFRAPTLNELFRPFRMGNNITEANPGLVPERLYGVEAGAGGTVGRASWSATTFYNWLVDPVTNVTVAKGPYNDPVEGYIPAGGLLIQRQNVGAVDAYGVEAEGSLALTDAVKANAALSWTHARVDGGAAAPQLTGLIPAETPAFTMTGGAAWTAWSRVTLLTNLRYESARFADDQNTLRLDAATTVGLRAEWRPRSGLMVFLEAANLLDVEVATDETAGGIYSYGPPRTISVGVSMTGGA